uniref:Putative secreted protein n=1 Tax=Anopheles darlingi TaxID=43151 RepID=A0A2M4DEZ4_ANODA
MCVCLCVSLNTLCPYVRGSSITRPRERSAEVELLVPGKRCKNKLQHILLEGGALGVKGLRKVSKQANKHTHKGCTKCPRNPWCTAMCFFGRSGPRNTATTNEVQH